MVLLKYSHLSINSGSTEKKAWENEGIRDETFILLLHSCCVHTLGRLYPKLQLSTEGRETLQQPRCAPANLLLWPCHRATGLPVGTPHLVLAQLVLSCSPWICLTFFWSVWKICLVFSCILCQWAWAFFCCMQKYFSCSKHDLVVLTRTRSVPEQARCGSLHTCCCMSQIPLQAQACLIFHPLAPWCMYVAPALLPCQWELLNPEILKSTRGKFCWFRAAAVPWPPDLATALLGFYLSGFFFFYYCSELNLWYILRMHSSRRWLITWGCCANSSYSACVKSCWKCWLFP